MTLPEALQVAGTVTAPIGAMESSTIRSEPPKSGEVSVPEFGNTTGLETDPAP